MSEETSSAAAVQTKKRKRLTEEIVDVHNMRLETIGLDTPAQAQQEELVQSLRLQNELQDSLAKVPKKFTSVFQPLLQQLAQRFLADPSAAVAANKLQPFIDADPSPNRKYVGWIVDSYINGGIRRFEDLGRTRSALEKFAKLLTLKSVLKETEKDVKQFCGIAGCLKKMRKQDGLEDLVQKYSNVLEQREEKKAKARTVKEEETVEVYNDDKIRIVQPRTEASACHYGQHTRWCTATTKGENMFKQYSATDNLYIIIPKEPKREGKKYQLHCKDKQYMDEEDNPISFEFVGSFSRT